MEFMVLAFLVAYAFKRTADQADLGRTSGNNGYVANVPGADKVHRRGRASAKGRVRYNTGYTLYQLRHGWPSLRRDLSGGWRDGKDAHEEWRREVPGKPSPWAAWKEGRKRGALPKEETAPAVEPTTPADAAEAPKAERAPEPRSKSLPEPIPLFPSMNGDTMTTPASTSGGAPGGDEGGISVYRAFNQRKIEEASRRAAEAAQEIRDAESAMQETETTDAHLASNDVGSDTAAGMIDLMEAAQARKAAAEQKLTQSEREAAAAQANLDRLDTQGHTNTEEAIKGMKAEPAKSGWYQE
jgi:hypothetical protein